MVLYASQFNVIEPTIGKNDPITKFVVVIFRLPPSSYKITKWEITDPNPNDLTDPADPTSPKLIEPFTGEDKPGSRLPSGTFVMTSSETGSQYKVTVKEKGLSLDMSELALAVGVDSSSDIVSKVRNFDFFDFSNFLQNFEIFVVNRAF